MAYPLVNIMNSTNYKATGTVVYPGCADDDYTVGPNQSWTAAHRGGCLVSQITAVLQTTTWGNVTASPYTSWGTSYSQFAIVGAGPTFTVTRLTSSTEEQAPIDDGEQATTQK